VIWKAPSRDTMAVIAPTADIPHPTMAATAMAAIMDIPAMVDTAMGDTAMVIQNTTAQDTTVPVTTATPTPLTADHTGKFTGNGEGDQLEILYILGF
jgi:hypothetical protein